MSTTADGELSVTAEAIAAILNCSTEKVYRMARNHDIPALKVGREWRFFASKVIGHLEAPKPDWYQSPQSRGRRRRNF